MMFKLSTTLLKWILVISVIATLLIVWTHDRVLHDSPPQARLTIDQIQTLSSLVTARVQVADVILVDQRGLTGGMQVAAVIKGDYLIETELSQARFEQVDSLNHRAILLLPSPQASNPRVDLERSRLFGLGSYGLWQITPGDAGYTALVNKTYEQAQGLIASASSNPAAFGQARRQAEAVLTAFLRALGWEVTVRWQDQPATNPSTPLTERNAMTTKSGPANQIDLKLAALRTRLAKSIGYLAARRWLIDRGIGDDDHSVTADLAPPDPQGIFSTNPPAAHSPRVAGSPPR